MTRRPFSGALASLCSREMIDTPMQKTADISDCGKYRYRLTRQWGDGPLLQFVMLNPSTADAAIDDPTIRRCVGFARREGAGGIAVANLFAFRATNPKSIELADNPYGPSNYDALGSMLRYSMARKMAVVCAWGAHQSAVNPGKVFIDRAKKMAVPLVCLGRTQKGFPRHPLYVKSSQILEWFAGPKIDEASALAPVAKMMRGS